MAKEPITTPCRTKEKAKDFNYKKKRNTASAFSESEINAAEQLIQLSGDSDSTKNDSSNDVVVVEFGSAEAEQSGVGDTTPHDLVSTASKEEYCFSPEDDQTTIVGFGGPSRKNKRFRSLYEIYSLTKPLSIVS